MDHSFVQIQLSICREISSALSPSGIHEMGKSGFLIRFRNSTLISRVDLDLNEIWCKDFGIRTAPMETYQLAISADGLLLGVIYMGEFKIIDLDGNILFVLKQGVYSPYQGPGCYFSADNELIWVISPDLELGDQVYALNRNDFSILASKRLKAGEEYIYTFCPTPDDRSIILDAAAGQDDGLLFLVKVTDGNMEVEELKQCNDRIMGSFAPKGQEFVTAPHYDEGLEIFSFPDIEKIASVEQDAIFKGRTEYPSDEDEDRLNYNVFYLNDQYILVFTRYHRLLLIERKSMRCTSELLLEGCKINAYNQSGEITTLSEEIYDYEGEIWDLKLTGNHQLLIQHKSGNIMLYDLPEWLS